LGVSSSAALEADSWVRGIRAVDWRLGAAGTSPR
jgi:hypothetical protein